MSELESLDLDSVDLRGRMVRVLGKGGKERIVPFNQAAERASRLAERSAPHVVERRARRKGEAEPLFVNYRGHG